MVPGGSPHRREVLHPPPPRNRGRIRGSTTERRTVHKDERTGQGARQRRDVGEQGKGRVLPCGLAKNAVKVAVGIRARATGAARDCLADRWWRRWKDGPKSGKKKKNVVGWAWLCIAWVAIRGPQTGSAFVVARPRPHAWAAVLLQPSSRPIRLPASSPCGDDGWTPGARENAIMAHLTDENNLRLLVGESLMKPGQFQRHRRKRLPLHQ